MDLSSFSHGQIQSKLWLCERLEKYIPKNAKVLILGGWYNTLGFLLASRNRGKIGHITSIDLNYDCKAIADKICEGFMIQPNDMISNVTADANLFDCMGYDVVINCSPEHMDTNNWFNNIKPWTLTCIQTSNVISDDPVWDIKNPNPNLNTFKSKYPMHRIYEAKSKTLQYNDWGYDRYMLIGLR